MQSGNGTRLLASLYSLAIQVTSNDTFKGGQAQSTNTNKEIKSTKLAHKNGGC